MYPRFFDFNKGDENVFAIGEAKAIVSNSKVAMPSEYHLKSKTLYGVWVGDTVLYISDEKQPLKSKSRDGMIFEPVIDANNRLTVPSKLDNYQAKITGRISTIEVVFKA